MGQVWCTIIGKTDSAEIQKEGRCILKKDLYAWLYDIRQLGRCKLKPPYIRNIVGLKSFYPNSMDMQFELEGFIFKRYNAAELITVGSALRIMKTTYGEVSGYYKAFSEKEIRKDEQDECFTTVHKIYFPEIVEKCKEFLQNRKNRRAYIYSLIKENKMASKEKKMKKDDKKREETPVRVLFTPQSFLDEAERKNEELSKER